MRISLNEQVKIRELTEKYFGEESTVRLFGSRVDDSLRGGDIDIYIEPADNSVNIADAKTKLWVALQKVLEEQKIDIVIANKKPLLIDKEAKTKGIILMNYKKAKFIEIIHECNKHLIILDRNCTVLEKIMPLTITKYDSLSEKFETALDVFLFRFTKLQDTVGEKLFPTILQESQEDIKNMTFIDRINRLDELGIVSWREWKPIRDKKNSVTHEYPSTPQKTVDALNAAFNCMSELYRITKKSIGFIHRKNILPIQIDKKLIIDIPFFERWENS